MLEGHFETFDISTVSMHRRLSNQSLSVLAFHSVQWLTGAAQRWLLAYGCFRSTTELPIICLPEPRFFVQVGFMTPENKLVRFDWAIKHILRDKANCDVLEGLLSALLKEDITVLNLLESKYNQEEETDKFSRVDLLVEDSQKRKFITEVQNNRETDYLERFLSLKICCVQENFLRKKLQKFWM